MYIKIKDNQIEKYPYLKNRLKIDSPQTSFPKEISNELLAQYGVFPVKPKECPQVDYTKNVAEGNPEIIEGVWTQVWIVTDKTQEEIEAITEQLRAEAYREESDPLFFKYQRDEIEKQEWLDKVAEIKARYPKDN